MRYLPDVCLFFGLAFLLTFAVIVYPLAALLICGFSLVALSVVLYRVERRTP